jgi:hypothetical protein
MLLGMSAYNPYLAPQAQDAGAPNGSYAPVWSRDGYVPLGWRTALATIAIAASAFFGIALDVVEMTVGEHAAGDSPDLGAALAVFLVALGFLGSLVFGAIFFGIWIHRAARNLRGLGRTGMKFSPAGCVGWFYVPLLNLVRPAKAMSELWRASESGEEADGYGWMGAGASTGLISLWWATWIIGNVIANVSGRIDDPARSGSVGIFGSVTMAVAGIACILLMRGVSARQESAAARLIAGAPR